MSMIISSERARMAIRRVAVAGALCALGASAPALAQDATSDPIAAATVTVVDPVTAQMSVTTTETTTTSTTTTTTSTTSTTTTPVTTAPVGPAAPTNKLAWNARVLAPVWARVYPTPGGKRITLVQPITPYTQGPTVLLVLDHKVVNGIPWTKVLLPRRPNGSAGWVRSDYLRFWRQRMRILIDQSSRMTYVYRDGALVYKARNAVGKAATPTPNGNFAIAEKAYLSWSNFLGPVVLVTTGFSEVLNEYAGGNGRFAMHGTSEPWVIGTRASHGCIRHYNTTIKRISYMVGVGTPLKIRW